MQILPDYEAKQFDLPPKFNKSQRERYFNLDVKFMAKVGRTRGNVNKIGLILQYGYFRASGKFYLTSQFHTSDMRFVAKMLGVDLPRLFRKQYVDRSRNNHRKAILSILGYSSFKQNITLFREVVSDLVSKHISPRKVVFSLIDWLNEKKIEVPRYNKFAEEIGKQYNEFEQNIIKQLSLVVTETDKLALDGLIEKSEYYQRPLMVGLKTIRQSIQPNQINKSVHGFIIIKKLFNELCPLIEKLNISPEAIRYYGKWVIKAKITQIADISDENRRYLVLLAFVIHQFKVWQDTFLDILLKVTKHYLNKAQLMLNAINTDNLPEKNKLTSSVLQAYNSNRVSINAVRSVLYNHSYSDQQKLASLYKIVPQEESNFDAKADDAASKLSQKINQDNDNKHYYEVLNKLSKKIQKRVAAIIKHLNFLPHETLSSLDKAISNYQTCEKITKKAPAEFLEPIEYRLIFEEDRFDVSLYKAILFIRIADAVKAGSLSLQYSYRYMSIDAYIMDKEMWLAQKDFILEKTGLTKFSEVEYVLSNLQQTLDPLFFTVNQRVKDGENPYVKLKKESGFSLHTPAIEKLDYESVIDLIGRERYISIIQMMADINVDTQFTSCFQHFKHKGSKSIPKDAVLFAGLFGLATNIGLHKLSSSALGVNYNTLSNAVEWRFSLENLHAVNDVLVERMNQLWLPSLFKKEQYMLHTSSDAQKRSVTAESLNANWSYKYFGNGKGANITGKTRIRA